MESLQMALAKVVVRRRKQMDLSQERFAYQAEIDRRHMADIEAGRATVPLRMLKRLADGFGLKASQLLEEAEREERQVSRPVSDKRPTSAKRRDSTAG